MSERWLAITSNQIGLLNVKSEGSAADGVVRYTPQDGAGVKADGIECAIPPGANHILLVVGNAVHIPIHGD